jgi:hypothetical protein
MSCAPRSQRSAATGLTLSVQAVPFKATAKEASVAMTVELDGAVLELAAQPNGSSQTRSRSRSSR